MHTILIQIPIKEEKRAKWDEMIMSDNGLPYTKSMQGFISAEFGWTKDDEGNSVWNLWEK